jgi:hypothetical protein
MKRQKIKVEHVRLLQEIRDRQKERTKRRQINASQGLIGQPYERPPVNPRIMDDLTSLLDLIDEIISI